jgi:phage gp46-like protein
MSDLLLEPTPDGGDLVYQPNGDFKRTSGLENAVYLSLFTAPWWGNAVSEANERYTSRIPDLKQRALTNQTRLDVIQAAEDALAWMTEQGVARRIEVDAYIRSAGRLDLAVRVYEPDKDTGTDFEFSVNWDSTGA